VRFRSVPSGFTPSVAIPGVSFQSRDEAGGHIFTASPKGGVATPPASFRLRQDASSSLVTFPVRGVRHIAHDAHFCIEGDV